MQDGYSKILEWMERINVEVAGLRDDRMTLLGTLGDVRDLMSHLQMDDRVQREAIANLTRRIDELETQMQN